MASAAYPGKLFYKAATPGSSFSGWAAVGGIKEASIDIGNAELESSVLGSRWRTFEYGLASGDLSASGFLDLTDTPQAAIEAAARAATKIYLGVSQDGTLGILGQFVVTKFTRGAPVDGLVPVSISAKLTGAPTLV